MPYEPMTVGGFEVIPLCDAVGPMGHGSHRSLTEAFPTATAEDWAGLDSGIWTLRFFCYLLRGPGERTVLVDTGLGGADSPASSWAPVPGALLTELTAIGVTPADIDVVIITHLHSDHYGGATDGTTPTFPAARYVLQRDEIEWAAPPVREYVLDPLGDQLHAVAGDAEVVPGIRVRHTPGHTPGHQVVGVGPLTLTGDVFLHPVQLANPRLGYFNDDDLERAVATRVALLDEIRGAGGTIGTAHFADPFTPLG